MAVLLPFSYRAKELLSQPPAPGEGRHHWLFKVGAALKSSDWKPESIKELLTKICATKGWQDRSGKTIDEILKKLDEDFIASTHERLPEWPAEHPEERAALFSTPALFDPFRPTSLTAQDVLPALFDPDDLVCVGWTKFRFSTLRYEDAIPVAHVAQFVVANPMRYETAKLGDKDSKRCKVNACLPDQRRFLVVEFDRGDTRYEQAAVLSALHRPEHPLVLAVWSGNKSIHAWYDVRNLRAYQKLVMFRYAVWLGADPATWNMAGLVRMPGGDREGVRQDILYFNNKERTK